MTTEAKVDDSSALLKAASVRGGLVNADSEKKIASDKDVQYFEKEPILLTDDCAPKILKDSSYGDLIKKQASSVSFRLENTHQDEESDANAGADDVNRPYFRRMDSDINHETDGKLPNDTFSFLISAKVSSIPFWTAAFIA